MAGALAMLGIAGCMVGMCRTRLGWTAQEIEAERRCEANQPAACSELGRLLVANVRSEKDLDRGMVLLETACGQNDGVACATLGGLYKTKGDERATARARELLARACELRVAQGCELLGELEQLDDLRHPQDARLALETFRRACELADARACELYGLAAGRLDIAGGHEIEERAFTLGCGLGRLPSCDLLAKLRMATPAGHDDGVALLIKACGRGFVPSCLSAAKLFAPIVGQSPACAQALPPAERACAMKDWDGCAIADACRIEGRNDAPAAIERLRDGCERGISAACLYWADAQEHPDTATPAVTAEQVQRAYGGACRGRPPVGPLGCTRFARLRLAGVVDAREAEHLTGFLQKGCDQSIAEACCALAQVYAGHGRDADAGKAAELRSKACTLGAQPCCHP